MEYKDMCFYRVWLRSFRDGNGDGIGDLQGVLDRLDYIQSLHTDGLWLSPVFPTGGENGTGGVTDFKSVAPEYGDLELFRLLLEEAHQRGMTVILDLPVNHSSHRHPWFKASCRGEKPYRDYYIWRKAAEGKKLPNNWQSQYGGPAWEWNENRKAFYLHLFDEKEPDLNMNNPAVRREFKSILRFWLELGVDGFQLEKVTFLSKAKGLPDGFPLMPVLRGIGKYNHGPNLHAMLQEFRRDVLEDSGTLTIGDAPFTTPRTALDYLIRPENDLDLLVPSAPMTGDCFFLSRLHHRFLLWKQKILWSRWQKSMEEQGWNLLYLESPDHPRAISRFGSEQFRSDCGKSLAVSYLFQQGTPCIYQGQEIGMTNIRLDSINCYNDPQTRSLYRGLSPKLARGGLRRVWTGSPESARTPMQWDDTRNAGFTEGEPWFYVNQNYREVNVADQESDPESLLNFYRRAMELRKEIPAVRSGSYRDLRPLSNKLHVYERRTRHTRLLVICSYSSKDVMFRAPRDYDLHQGRLLLTSHGSEHKNGSFLLHPYETRVYYFDDRRK